MLRKFTRSRGGRKGTNKQKCTSTWSNKINNPNRTSSVESITINTVACHAHSSIFIAVLILKISTEIEDIKIVPSCRVNYESVSISVSVKKCAFECTVLEFFPLKLEIYLFIFVFRKSKYALSMPGPGWVIGLSKPFAINVSFSSLFFFLLLILFQFLSNFMDDTYSRKSVFCLKPILVAENEMNTQNPSKAIASILTYCLLLTYLKSISEAFLFSQTMEICI